MAGSTSIRRTRPACLAAALLALLLAGCSAHESREAAAPQVTEAMQQADYVGEGVCRGCHQQESSHWSHTVHARAFGAAAATLPASRGCEACHGPGSAHLSDPYAQGLIVAFTHDATASVAQQNGMCLQCHGGGERLFWNGSAHHRQDLGCADCHNPMARNSSMGLLREQGINETCFGCHLKERVDFRKRSHMPLPEGRMDCADCHNPHGSNTQPMLTAITINQLCYDCHQEKRGPFLWEHAPVREDCMNCHVPHGSNHEALLVATRPFLCQQCHSNRGHPNDLLTTGNLPGGEFADARLMNRSCQNCHTQIHGSNHPSGARFQR